MAQRTWYPSNNYGAARVYCEVRFTAPGASTTGDLTLVDGADIISSIAHVAGTNVVTVTLKDAFPKVIGVNADVRDDSQAGIWASVGSIANEGTSTPITLKVAYWVAAGTASNNSTAVTCLTFAFKNTNGQGAK